MMAAADELCVKSPCSSAAWKLLGVALMSSGRDGLLQLERSLELDATDVDTLNNLGNACRVVVGQQHRAEGYYLRAIRIRPKLPEPHFNLAGLYLAEERWPEAEREYRAAIELRPEYADAFNNLGLVLQAQQRPDDAARAWEHTIKLRPTSAEAYYNLANVEVLRHETTRAIQYFEKALEYRQHYAEAANNLGSAYQDAGDHVRAAQSFRRAIEINPMLSEGHNNLGLSLQRLDQLGDAELHLKRAIELRPTNHDTYSGLGSVYITMGRLSDAAEQFRHALIIRPDFIGAHHNLIFALDMLPDTTEAYWERARWNECVTRNAPEYRHHVRESGAKIRIGYVSGDFRAHSAVSAFGAVFLNHDLSEFEIYAYSNYTGADDGLTAILKLKSTAWCNISRMSDLTAIERIRNDHIDILVDLSGHTSGNRLGIFANRAAPVQITAWGYATGTGLNEMDVFLADQVLVPESERRLITEQIIDVPCVACAYFSEAFPDIAPTEHAGVVFGSLNRITKISDEAFVAWCVILRTVPNSRMIMKAPELSDPACAAMVRLKFGDLADRVELRGRSTWFEHVRTYNEIDVVLDPFPHGGGVTTMESLIMGVPTISLRWPTVVGRVSASILTTAGFSEWVVDTVEKYIVLARSVAPRDRNEVRKQFYASPVGDQVAYVQAIEDVYRKVLDTTIVSGYPHHLRATAPKI